jgi:hypothetical protein
MDRAVVEELVATLKLARKLLRQCSYVGPERETIDEVIAAAERELNKPIDMGR